MKYEIWNNIYNHTYELLKTVEVTTLTELVAILESYPESECNKLMTYDGEKLGPTYCDFYNNESFNYIKNHSKL